MKVLFVCPFVPWPLVNGGKIRTFQLIKAVSAHADVHLRVVREPDVAPDAEEALAPWCGSLSFFDRTRPGRLKELLLPKLERWFHSAPLFEAIRADLAGGGFQLVHLDELLLARIVAPDRAVPVVQHHHKLDTVLYDTLSTGQGARRHFDLWKLGRLERESARRYRHHLFCSPDDAEIMRGRHGALDVGVVPSGFDPEQFRASVPTPERSTDRLLFLGSMDYGPNIDAVIWFVKEVLPLVRERRPATGLDIVGRAPTRAVEALASDAVDVIGAVPEVRTWIERAAAMVVPLRIGGGTRLKIVEALALGTPVVSTRMGSSGLGLQDGDELVLADSAEELAAATLRLLEDPARAAALGERGRVRVHERYPWSVLAEELVDYWERVAFSGKLSPSR